MTDAADKRAPLSLSETRSTADANLALLKRLAGYACGSLSDSFSIRQLGGLALRLLAEHATLRAKLAEAERERADDMATAEQRIQQYMAERNAATARAAEAEAERQRLLLREAELSAHIGCIYTERERCIVIMPGSYDRVVVGREELARLRGAIDRAQQAVENERASARLQSLKTREPKP